MPRKPYTAFQYGPAAVYSSPTGQLDVNTFQPYLGTELIQGDFADLTNNDANVWSRQYFAGQTPLYGGRYRFVAVALQATSANMVPFGLVGWSTDNNIRSVGITPGTGYTPGTYTLTSTTPVAGQIAAVAVVTVGSNGSIVAGYIAQPGYGFYPASIPTFSLTALGSGSGGAVIAQLGITGDTVTSWDSSALSTNSMPRGILLANPVPTAAQIAGFCWVVIQELGMCPVQLGGTVAGAAGANINASASGTPQLTATTPAYSALQVGTAIDAPVANQIIRCDLTLQEQPW